MFQSLRPNSQIYILHKGDKPTFEVGYITNVSAPRSKYGTNPAFTQPQDLIVDIVAKVNEAIVNYNGLPANLDIADSFLGGDPIVISDNRDAINSEVKKKKKKSQDILDSVDYNRNLISEYEKILCSINPEIAEKQSQKTEIESIKNQMLDLSANVASLMETNRLLLEQLKKGNNYENVGNN